MIATSIVKLLGNLIRTIIWRDLQYRLLDIYYYKTIKKAERVDSKYSILYATRFINISIIIRRINKWNNKHYYKRSKTQRVIKKFLLSSFMKESLKSIDLIIKKLGSEKMNT